ncbi:MAG: hypothetical protein K9G33_14710, partial [Sneathiella sp.]|nr:hypothetical protein [Sneathiella sp.]
MNRTSFYQKHSGSAAGEGSRGLLRHNEGDDKNIKIVVDVGLGWSYNAALADLAGICFGLFLVIRGWIFVGLVLSGR